MIQKLMASIAAAETLVAAAVLGVGVATITDPGAGLVAFGGAWFLVALVDHVRGAA